MTTLERLALLAWREWGLYAQVRPCSECGERVACRAHRRRGPWLCLPCFDQEIPSR